MPNGVICAGAVEGSNQLGAIVTCQAMTARPAGAGPSAADAAPPKTSVPVNSKAAAKRQPRSLIDVIRPLPFERYPSRRVMAPVTGIVRRFTGFRASTLNAPLPPGVHAPPLP